MGIETLTFEVSGTVTQYIDILYKEYDIETIVEGLKKGLFVTTTWYEKGERNFIENLATNEIIAEIIAQEVEGEYSDFNYEYVDALVNNG